MVKLAERRSVLVLIDNNRTVERTFGLQSQYLIYKDNIMLKPISLVGEQRKVLTLSHEGPIQIKGGAGSGKTTVAVYRACHLMDTYNDIFEPSKVAIFTFNKSLSGYLYSLTHDLNSNDYRDMKIINFHKWAFSFIKSSGKDLYGKTIFTNEIHRIVRIIISNTPKTPENTRILTKTMDFYSDEISWLKGKNIRTLQQYLDTKRIGRGTTDRITGTDKHMLWHLFDTYNQELQRLGKYDFDDYALLCLDIIQNKGNTFSPPFTHLVIDEAQDLNQAQLSVLIKIVSPTTSSITIIADAAQRIYKSGFSWKEIGLNVRGARTVEFKKNYRNSEFIAKAALSLLKYDNDSDDFTTVEVNNIGGQKTGVKSLINIYEEQLFIANQLDNIRSNFPKDSICVLHRTNNGLSSLVKFLENKKIKIDKINGNSTVNYSESSIKVSTMQSVKGLEFDHLIISGLTDDVLPIKAGFSEPDDDLHITTERRLLYTCMTRAIKGLTLTYAGVPSRYLAEIEPDFLESI